MNHIVYLIMMHYKNITLNEDTDLPDVIVDCILQAWKPAVHTLLHDLDAPSMIQNLAKKDNSEFAVKNIKALSADQDVIGITLSLSMSDIHAARQINIFNMLDHTPDKAHLMKALIHYNEHFQSLPKDEKGTYLSKFAISKKYQGQGMSKILMEHFLEDDRQDMPIFLEVHRLNKVAIKLYTDYGFENISTQLNKEYHLMKRTK